MISVNIVKGDDIKGCTLILGFPGAGLVGSMAISYMIEKLDLIYIGYFESAMFPPLMSIHKKKPLPPIRLYYSEKDRFVCVFSEFSIITEVVYDLSNAIMDMVREKKLAGIVSMGGMPIHEGDEKYLNTIFGIASDKETMDRMVKAGIKPITEGVSTGVNAILMVKSADVGVSNADILVPVSDNITDPKYAEIAIGAINKYLGLNIDTTELEKEAELAEAKIKELLEKSKQTHERYKSLGDQPGPSMYA